MKGQKQNIITDQKLQEAKSFSLANHLKQIQEASEQRLKAQPISNTPMGSDSGVQASPIGGQQDDAGVSQVNAGSSSQESPSAVGSQAVANGGAQSSTSGDMGVLNDGGLGEAGPQSPNAVSAGQQEINQEDNNTQRALDLLDVYVDAKDSVNNWCVAKIVDHDLPNNKISIHFDGWSPRYDETQRVTSSRIAPFRKYTQGYTGQTRVALREFDLNYAYQVTLHNRIQKVVQTEFRCFESATECTQFIRGEIYFYFDSLLTLVPDATTADLQKIFEFATAIFGLCLKWVDVFPNYVEVYRLCANNATLFLVDARAAIASCGYEILHMLHKCFGLCERTNRSFNKFRSCNIYPSQYADEQGMANNGFMLSLAGKFGDMGGFQKLLDFVKIGGMGNDFKCPIAISCLALETMSVLCGARDMVAKDSWAVEFSKTAADHLSERLLPENFTDAEIKEVNLDELKKLIRLTARYKARDKNEKERNQYQNEVLELLELEIAKRFLLSPYFEKRIKGMQEFKFIQEKILNRVARTAQENRNLGLEQASYLDLKTFSEWIIQHKVLDFIFKENPHSELIKRSYNILHILAQDEQTFPEELVSMIWSCCSSEKHEDIVRAAYELITEMASCLPQQQHQSLFSKIQNLSFSQIGDKEVLFLKDYTINTIRNLREAKRVQANNTGKGGRQGNGNNQGSGGISQMFVRQSQGKKSSVVASSSSTSSSAPVQPATDPDDLYFNLRVFWDIAQDANLNANHRTKELSLSSLIEILKLGRSYKSDIREPFLNLALENIKVGNTVYFSVSFLQRLLNTFPHDDQQHMLGSNSSHGNRNNRGRGNQQQQQQESSIESLISGILKKVDLHQHVINQGAAYMKRFKESQENENQISSGVLSDQLMKDESSPQIEETKGLVSQSSVNPVQASITSSKSSISHEDHIRVFFNFVEFIVINSRSITLQFQHVQEMFKIFVTEANTEIETREFFDFLTKQNQNARNRERMFLLDEKLRFQVFTKIMCNEKSMNCLNLNIQAYECFHSLFIGVNSQEGTLSLDRDSNILQVSNVGSVQGLNSKWRIAINCADDQVKEMCRSSLCDVYLLTKSKNQSQRLQVHEKFLKICRTTLTTAQASRAKGENLKEQHNIVFNCLRLIKTFIQRFDKEHLIPELKSKLDNLTPIDQRNTRKVGIKLDPDGVRSEVEVNLNCKFWELMRKSSQLLNIKMSEFYILTKQGALPDNIYNDFMKDYDLKEVQFQRIPPETMEKEFPSYVIGQNSECLEIFLDVLSWHEDSITNEVISLVELLQMNPNIKNKLSDRIGKLKIVPPSQISDNAEDVIPYFKEWSINLGWEQNRELNQTFYMLTCLKELTQGKAGPQGGYGGVQSNPNVIQSQQLPQALMQAQQQERQMRAELREQLLRKGGFNFLLYMFSKMNKEVDFEKDTLSSKTLQLLIFLLNQMHSAKLQPILATYQRSWHINEMLQGCLTIVHSFLRHVNEKQRLKQEELLSTKQNSGQGTNNSGTPNIENVYMQLQNQGFETIILTASLNFLTKILNTHPESFQGLQNNPKFLQILKYGLIDISQKKIQDKISIFSVNLCTKIEQLLINPKPSQVSQQLPIGAEEAPSFLILNTSIKEFIPLSLKEANIQKMRTLYKLINNIVNDTDVHKSLDKIETPAVLVQNLIKMIQDREIKEATSRDEDVVLAGLMDLVGLVLCRFPAVRQNLPEKKRLIEFLTHQGLFKKEKRMITQLSDERAAKNLPPMCKHSATRNSCLDVLRSLCLDDLQDKLYLTSYIKLNVCNETYWRTPRKVDWTIHGQQQERALSGFVGLKNLGCICYMNSILQQLYMIPAFRQAIIEVEDRHEDKQPEEENVLFQVKGIFAGLMEVEKQYFNPKKFCKAMKDIDGSPFDINLQKDCDEFFLSFMDRIEGLIKGTKEEKILNNLIQGIQANEIICVGCPHYSEREESCLAMRLEVKNKNSVLDSLKYYVEGEMLEGDNAYYCEKCEKKVSALKRSCIKRLPNILFLALKRFEFDFETMMRVKVNDYCEFPIELDMRPYSQQELARQDLIKKMEEKNWSADDLNEDEKHILERKVPESYYKYKLKGIVVHSGTADQGHYYSYIQDRGDKEAGWFEFNDTLVTEFNPTDIAEETFGGDDDSVTSNINELQAQNNGQVDQGVIQAMRQSRTKLQNAYVLIYDRVELYDMAKVNDVLDDTKTISLSAKELAKQYAACKVNAPVATIPMIPHNVHDVILAKNKKFWLSKTIFSVAFIAQMHRIFQDIRIKEDNDYEKYSSPTYDLQASDPNNGQFEAFKFVITFFLTVGLRSKERSVLPEYVALIRAALKKNIGLSLWLLETFSSQAFIKEFLIDCPIHDMARFVQGLLKTAMQQVYQREKEQIDAYNQVISKSQGLVEYIRSTQHEYIEEDTVVAGPSLHSDVEQNVNSGCTQVNLIRLRAHTTQMPKLIILMNSFIHMSTSIHLRRNAKMAGQFWAVFANFSMLGDQARLYLLQTKNLGRLIDVLLNLQPDHFFADEAIAQYAVKFRDTSLRNDVPLIVYAKDTYIGMDPERAQVQLSAAERKQIHSLLSPPSTFLILAISNLSRSCTLVKHAGPAPKSLSATFSLDFLNFVPDKEEIELLQSHKNLRWGWNNSPSKLAKNSVAAMFAHISADNREFGADYIQNLIALISKAPSTGIRNFERPLLRVVQVDDKFQGDRIKRVLLKLTELFKSCMTYFVQSDAIMEMVYKLAVRCPAFAQALASQHQDLIKFIERYTKENPTLPVGANRLKIFKEGPLKWQEIAGSNVLNQARLDWITNYSRTRTSRLQSHLKKSPSEQVRVAALAGANDILQEGYAGFLSTAPSESNDSALQGDSITDEKSSSRASARSQKTNTGSSTQNPQEEVFDSDDDLYNRQYVAGQYLDFCHGSHNQLRWYQGRVEVALDEMVKCVAKTNNDPQIVRWIGLETDELAQPNSMTNSDREHLHRFFLELCQYVSVGQQQQTQQSRGGNRR